MTDPERAALIRHLTGRGWVTLTTIRAEMQWPQSALLATDLLACVTALREERVVRTTPAWKAPFAVCLESEIVL